MAKDSAKFTVIDFFCGAGGFSEGFRQQGMRIVMGLDNWKPAVETHNLNHGLDDEPYDISGLWGESSSDVKKIDGLPDTDMIIGSPPCVSFSMSNKAGKADKSLGIHLIKTYLRFIAVKKHQHNSILKAWLLENVPNSEKYIQDRYSFVELNLEQWAEANGLDPSSTAIVKRGQVLISSDYGAPQSRRRYVCGEVISSGKFPLPDVTDGLKTLGQIKSVMPIPLLDKSDKKWRDPNYPQLQLDTVHITDHFYDTGLYKSEWDKARELKLYHPFMGKMSFPENTDKPSRTITATRSGSTRESLIFKSELLREGHGEYRLPTIRETATLMGYPYTYQFVGSENTKWKLIGNSVSPQLSFALAGKILNDLGSRDKKIEEVVFNKIPSEHNPTNLNTFLPKSFETQKRRQRGSKFRRVIIKERNMTLELLNYHPEKPGLVGEKWFLCAFKGTGRGYKQYIFENKKQDIESRVKYQIPLVTILKKLEVSGDILQRIYETDLGIEHELNPVRIVHELRTEVESFAYQELANLPRISAGDGIIMGERQSLVAANFAIA